jgi:hypothetical protein
MLLLYDNQDPFATGAQPYQERPATETEAINRLFIEVEIGGFRTSAVIDTGAPYVVCAPDIAESIGLTPAAAIVPDQRLNVRGYPVRGNLYRIDLTLKAEEGDDVTVDATAFVPEEEWALPSVIGWDGCLQRIRFGIDPVNEIFFFGEPV